MPEISLGTVVGPPGPQGPKGDDGTFSPEDLQRIEALETGKVDKVSGKGLSTNDYTDTDKNAVANIGNKVDKVTGKGLSTNDYTDADKNAVANIGNKVDKVSGKGLSTNDYTTAEKNKLSGIEAQANRTTIDATLSNAGQAADAKATGDAIAFLRDYLNSMEIYRKASGNPATFSDGAAANVKDLRVTITPKQSGSGDPYPPGGGKNLFNAYRDAATINGVTFTPTKNANGEIVYISTSGTATALTQYAMPLNIKPSVGDYTLSGCPSGGSYGSYDLRYTDYVDTGNGVAMRVQDGDYVAVHITIRKGFNADGLVFRPMIRRTSDSDPTFAPYSNIRPISGVSSVNVTRTGENGANPQSVSVTLTDGTNPLTVYGGTLDITTGVLTVTNASARLLNAERYNFEGTVGAMCPNRLGRNGTRLTGLCSHGICTTTFYPSNDATPSYLWLGVNNAHIYWVNILNVLGLSSIEEFNEWLNNNEVTVIYPLAAPVTYQLTPAQLTTLSGYNAVSTDAESVDVTYKADTIPIFGGG